MINISTEEIIISIVIPILMIIIIFYLYKDNFFKFLKKTKKGVEKLPVGEDTKQEKQEKKENREIARQKRKVLGRVPRLLGK